MNLTQARLKELFSYDANTGRFTRIANKGPSKVGDVAGRIVHHGYRKICVDMREYYEHRLVWLYATGRWPTKHIDHINGRKDDNRFCNLREATQADNMRNMPVHRGVDAQPAGGH